MDVRFSLADLRALFRLPLRSTPAPPMLTQIPSQGTISAGRNAEKRKARAASKSLRQRLVAKALPGTRVPKLEYSRLMIDMLANRRLRQRAVQS